MTTPASGAPIDFTVSTSTGTYSSKAGFPIPQVNDLNWHLPLQTFIKMVEKQAAIGPLCVSVSTPGSTASPVPSTSLSVDVGGGTFLNASGAAVSYAGSTGNTLTASTTTRLWLDDSGTLNTGSSYPSSTQFVPLASVTTNATTITAISDDRVIYRSYGGSAAGYVGKAGDTLGDGSNFVLGTVTGTRLGTSSTQKLGFFGATPVVQPASTTDLITALEALGLIGSAGATPLNLNGGTLQGSVRLPVTTINSSVGLSALGLFTVSAAGNITITLPDATSNAGGLITFKRTDSTSNTVTVTRAGTDLIDGASTNTSLSSQWSVLRLIAVSGAWYVV